MEGTFEAKVSGKRESSSGIYLTLLINPADYNADLATLRVGSTLSMGWVETVNTAVEMICAAPDIVAAVQKVEKDRKPFAALPLPSQVAIRCQDEAFQRFISNKIGLNGPYGEAAAIDWVRRSCGVMSRADITKGSAAELLWESIEEKFQAYLTDQRYASARK